MNYIKLNLPPTICDLVKCQELIDSKIKPTQFGVKLMRKFWSELNNATYNEKNQHTKLKKWVKSKQSPNELIAGSNLTQAEKDEVIFTDKYDTPKKVKQLLKSKKI